MITGAVSPTGEAVVPLRVRGPGGAVADLYAVIDTGFTSYLALPPATTAALGLVPQTVGTALLGDGSTVAHDIYAADVEWGGTWQPVLVAAVGSEVLLGMALLAGHRLCMDVTPGGAVDITPLP